MLDNFSDITIREIELIATLRDPFVRPSHLVPTFLACLCFAAPALAQGTDRWVGPYAGAGFGTASGAATGIGPAQTAQVCNIAGKQYDLIDSVAIDPYDSIMEFPAWPGLPADIDVISNGLAVFDADALGLIAVGSPIDFELDMAPDGEDSRPVIVNAQPLGFGPLGVQAVIDGRDTIFDPDLLASVPNPFDCLILDPVDAHIGAVEQYPSGTLALEFEGGPQVLAWSEQEGFLAGNFEDAVIGGGGTSTDLSGTFVGLLAGHTWALGDGWLASVEGRAYLGDVAGGEVRSENLLILGGRAGLPLGNTYVFASLGLAMSEIGVGGVSNRASGVSLGLGSEHALNDRMSVRFDVTHVDFGESDFGAARDVSVSYTLGAAALVIRF